MDPLESSREVADGVSFPVAWGVTRETARNLGSFWDDRKDFIQPTEFIVSGGGRIMSSTYSSSPVGRLDPDDALKLIGMLAERKSRS